VRRRPTRSIAALMSSCSIPSRTKAETVDKLFRNANGLYPSRDSTIGLLRIHLPKLQA
jgi:hypothetical protein